MTIGRNSRKGSLRSSIRAPKFLDKSSGFYDRLDEPEMSGERDEERGGRETEVGRWNGTQVEGEVVKTSGPISTAEVHVSGAEGRGEAGVFDFNQGMMEDDGEILLRRRPSRRSSRWSRSSWRKQQKGEAHAEDDLPGDERSSQGTESRADSPAVLEVTTIEVVEMGVSKKEEPALVHFAMREDGDDQVLIRDKKRGREEEKKEEEEKEEERRMKREQEEGMKMVKRNTLRNYRKTLDRAFRRGWESFITNLYSVTLTPISSTSSPSSSSSSPSLKKKHQHNSVLAEFR